MQRYINTGMNMPNTSNHKREDTCFFSQFASVETLELPENMPDIGQVVSVVVDPEVISMKVIKGVEGTSWEGLRLTGKKVAVYVRLKQKILYSAGPQEQTIHTLENDIYHNVYVVIPPYIKGTDPELLIKYKHLRSKATVEDALAKKINNRLIFENISLLVRLYVLPSYEICYSLQQEKGAGSIYLCMEQGRDSICISPQQHNRSIKPLWSPTGQEIGFLSGSDGECMLYVYSLKNSSSRRITDPLEFKSIGSFCWSKDESCIIFSAPGEKNRELFSVNIHSLKWKQLTFGDSGINSCKPKQCPADDRIGFLKSISGITYLYTMNKDGLDVKMASSTAGVKDFSWSRDGKYIAYIKSRTGKTDELWLIDMLKGDERHLYTPEHIVEKDKLEFSRDGSLLAFIGSDLDTEDVFVHHIARDRTINTTRNYKAARVSSFGWNGDSDKIYYCTNELSYYNIYSVSLKNGDKHQITNSTASYITLDCRPKIR